MNIEINEKNYEVIITYKNIKNMYLRVKSDLKIYITCSKYMSKSTILKFVQDNINSIYKQLMIFEEKSKRLNNKLLFLGFTYDICYTDSKKIIFGNDKVFINRTFNIDKWYKKEAEKLFLERLDYIYNKFEENIPYPKLKIRKMTSKWGVCNTKEVIITLNLELIKMDTKYLDYVIVHELSHLVFPNHSNLFWNLVSKYIDNYKKYRKEMKNVI